MGAPSTGVLFFPTGKNREKYNPEVQNPMHPCFDAKQILPNHVFPFRGKIGKIITEPPSDSKHSLAGIHGLALIQKQNSAQSKFSLLGENRENIAEPRGKITGLLPAAIGGDEY